MTRRGSLTRSIASLVTLTLTATGWALTNAPPSQARVPRLTDYGFQGTAYGTQVFSSVAGLQSGKSGFSWIACTRVLGEKAKEGLAAIDLPADSPSIQVDGVASSNRTYRKKRKGIDAAITSVNRISRVRLGTADTPRLTVRGLRSQSTAWANSNGRLKAENKVTASDLSLVNLPSPAPGSPLDDLVDSLDQGIDEVLQTLVENGGTIEIPVLGTVSVGYNRLSQRKNFAVAGSFVLKVLLYGPDGAEGGGDDSLVGIGHSRARINRQLPAAVMTGLGYGASAKVVDGVVKVGKLGKQPLPCRGTDGAVLDAPTAALNFLSADELVATGLTGRVSGKQFTSGKAWAWSAGEVSSFELGPLEIRGIRGRAKVKQNKAGKITKRNIAGSSLGEILVDGESQGAFTPGNADEIPPMDIPGVSSVEFFVTDKSKRGLKTSAVVITFTDDTPGVSTLRLGNAQVGLKRK